MTQIDRVSFDFVVPGEGIASGLLSGWDAFCHRCFEQVVEEFFAPYDREDVRYAFDQVELDLGAIPEADFYRLYPLRLKEALRRAVSFDGKHIRHREGAPGHLAGILYGLKYGALLESGAERDIDAFFEKEIGWLATQPETVKADCLHQMASLALSEEGALRRMILHFDDDDLLLGVFGAGLAKPDYTVWQKNRFLLSFLELAGSVPVRFIHESDGKNDLSRMAELLDSGSVWKIMQVEMTRQSKPGLAFYWHYLYEWLLRYYPYNDVSLFGGKSQFVNHLHFRFLTFVHKQPFLSFYSEYDLTVQFLQEVFGRDKYLYVSEAINRLLNQNLGNVTHHSRYGESLYLSFLRISLLYHRETDRPEAEPEMVLLDGEKIKALMRESAKQPYSKAAFQAVQFAGAWLKQHARNKEMVVEYLAPVANETFVNGMLASVSLALLDDVRRVKQAVLANRGAFSWMKGVVDDKLEEAWNRSVLLWLSESGHSGPFDVEKLLVRFHKEVSGSENTAEEEALVRLCREPSPRQERAEAEDSVWIGPEDWRNQAYGISVSVTETFIRILETFQLDLQTESQVWAAFFARCEVERLRNNTLGENVAQFVEVLAECCPDKAPDCRRIISEFVPPARTEPVPVVPAVPTAPELPEEEMVSYRIGNAGLCLLSPWLLRLYDRLGYLDPERKKFKDTYSRIRAVFVLQYLVYGEERKYPESDLPFNCLLADLPFSVPLPRQLPLTEVEMQTADGMIAGVKANWPKMDGTSVAGFRRSFILRGGRLVRHEGRWLLTVDENAYDVLLDTVPWAFRQIRLPWIKGYIQVVWHDKQII